LVEAMDAGADDFVAKPFDQNELRARIRAGERVISLERTLAERNHRLEQVNRRMKDELLAAARIQRSYLPSKPPDTPGAEFAWIYEPCDELGGDTLNIVPFDSTHFGVYVLDVSGHGVSSALLSVNLSRLLTHLDEPDALLRKSQAAGGGPPKLTPPSEAVAQLNTMFSDDPESGQFFTLLYGIIDLEALTFRYTSAGHPGPIIARAGETDIRKATPPAIGFLPTAKFREHTVELQPRDRLFLYTDGVFEIENHEGEEWGESRLAEAAEANLDLTVSENLEATLHAAQQWQGEASFNDDVSMLGIAVL